MSLLTRFPVTQFILAYQCLRIFLTHSFHYLLSAFSGNDQLSNVNSTESQNSHNLSLVDLSSLLCILCKNSISLHGPWARLLFMPFTTSVYIISCQPLFPHLQVGTHNIVLVRPSLNGGKVPRARSGIHKAGSKDKEALSSQVSPIPEGCTSCLLFHRAIHEEKWYPALPQDPLFLPVLLPFVPFSSSPPSHSPSAFALPI